MKKIAVIIGNPIEGSFTHAMASTYAEAARAQGAEVRVIDLATSSFAETTHERNELKVAGLADTKRLGDTVSGFAETIQWANHLVFAYPVWWGTYPAVLKGFFDRVFLSGFVFANKKGPQWDKFLTGRTARIFVTMDAPVAFDYIWYRSASVSSVKHAILWYTGIRTTGVTKFDRVRFSSAELREKWLFKVAGLARSDAKK
jgi:NAD(P)H dehydrogenase (quinone)